jgi:hypothetical protein
LLENKSLAPIELATLEAMDAQPVQLSELQASD